MNTKARTRAALVAVIAAVLLEQYAWYRHRRLLEQINREMRQSPSDHRD